MAISEDIHCFVPSHFAWQSSGSFKCNVCMLSLTEGMDMFMLNDHSYCSKVCLKACLNLQPSSALQKLSTTQKEPPEGVYELNEAFLDGHAQGSSSSLPEESVNRRSVFSCMKSQCL